MNDSTQSTRRSFLKVGAVLATPVGAAAVPAVAFAEDGARNRLERLEAEAAIRDLHQNWLRAVNRGAAAAELGVHAIAADHAGEPDALHVTANGLRATGRYHCVVETVTEIAPDCTLAQMKHAMGEGTVRRTARRVVQAEYVRGAESWEIAAVTLA